MATKVQQFQLGDRVKWKSQAAGTWLEKEGEIVEVVPAGKRPKNVASLPRTFDSYVVRAVPKGREKEVAAFYWPRPSALELVSRAEADGSYARAAIEGGDLVIRLRIANIPSAFQGGVDCGAIEPGFKVVDAQAFALEVLRALNDEDEDGTTPVHRMFDAAFEEAVEQGAEGVEETARGAQGEA